MSRTDCRNAFGDSIVSGRPRIWLRRGRARHVVIDLCEQQRRTLAAAEVGSGGLLTHWLSEADNSRRVFYGGFVPQLRRATTQPATAALAEEARVALGADIGLALSDFPNSDSTLGPPGEIHIAVAGLPGTPTASFPFTGHPEILQPRAVKQALNFLRLQLRTCSYIKRSGQFLPGNRHAQMSPLVANAVRNRTCRRRSQN